MINILIIDQKRLFSEGIGVFLSNQKDMQIFGPEESQEKTKELLAGNNLQVILLNRLLSTFDVHKFTMRIKRESPELKIIHYAEKLDEEMIIQSLSCGADSLFLENIKPNHLIQSIHAIVNGATFFPEEITNILADQFRHLEIDEKVKFQKRLNKREIHLTQREIDVALLVEKGYSNRYIAEKLHLSEGTIKNYVSELYKIFNKTNRKALIDFIRQI